MKVICCTGDSHTWGQGASGIIESFAPPVVGGDLRPVGFSFPSYVNLIRDAFMKKEDAAEFTADMLGATSEGCYRVEGECRIRAKGGLFRLVMQATSEESAFEFIVDGKVMLTKALPAVDYFNSFRIFPIFTDDGEHEITIRRTMGAPAFYRLECYSGEYAVINCGVGSCPSDRYLAEFWESYVEAYHPSVVIMEAHTINDWLTTQPPENCNATLLKMIEKSRGMGAKPILMSVEPVLGSTKNQAGGEYDSYVEASRKAAEISGCAFADTNAVMAKMLEGLTEEEKFALLFADCWHPNDLGHKIYADEVLKLI